MLKTKINRLDPQNKPIDKILLIKLRAIGDVVMSTIVIPNIRAAFPAAQIDFLTQDFCKDVVSGHESITDILIFERNLQKSWPFYRQWKADLEFIQQVRKRQYDLVFDFFGNPRTALLTFFSGAEKRVGYNYRIRKHAYNVQVRSRADMLHEVDWHLDALTTVGIPVVAKNLSFPISKADHHYAKEFFIQSGLDGKPVIGLNFSGGWAAKQWPLSHFAALASELVSEFDVKICIIWGPGEKESALRLAANSVVPVILIPDTNLKQLGAILSRLHLLVSTDSGPMHIAAACGVPCVGIYGPTNPDLQGPYGEQHEIVRKKNLDCLGCNRLDCDHRSCMNTLSVSDVLAVVRKRFYENQLLKRAKL